MTMETLVINGTHFSTLETFYDEVEKALTTDSIIGRNLDAFNDTLRGGFGRFEYKQPIILVWKNSDKSRIDLGWVETVRYFEAKLRRCHLSNRDSVGKELDLARQEQGLTIFDILLEIITEHDHVTLELC